MRYLDRLHPVCAFVYFAEVILLTMITMHPVAVSVCFVTGLTLYGVLCGGRRLAGSLKFSLPLVVLIAVLNPLFSHKGSTVLLFVNDNPITLESCVYGLVSALMLAAVFYWFAAYSEIMTSDKFIYLFGRIIPKLSLLLSMTLTAIPRLKKQYREIEEAQRATGGAGAGGYVARLKLRLRVISALVSRALEGSVETADSMRARGYGLRGRTAYSLYRFTVPDGAMLGVSLTLFGAVLWLIGMGAADFSYYPLLDTAMLSPASLALDVVLLALTGMAILMEGKEAISWRISRSSI